MSDVIDELIYEVGELKRRQANIIQYGTIAEPRLGDPKNDTRARVKIGDLTTARLPWVTSRAGDDVTWWKPNVGEQVVVLSSCGDLAQGTILPSLYQNKYMPKKLKDKTVVAGDDTEISEDKIDIPDAGIFLARIAGTTIQIDKNGNVEVNSPTTISMECSTPDDGGGDDPNKQPEAGIEAAPPVGGNEQVEPATPKLTLVAPDIELKTRQIKLVHMDEKNDDIVFLSDSKIKFDTDLHVTGKLKVDSYVEAIGDVFSMVKDEKGVGLALHTHQENDSITDEAPADDPVS